MTHNTIGGSRRYIFKKKSLINISEWKKFTIFLPFLATRYVTPRGKIAIFIPTSTTMHSLLEDIRIT